jgi:hypothetical protein
MFNYLKYRLRLFRLERHNRKATKRYKEKIKETIGSQNDWMELQSLSEESDKWQHGIDSFKTEYYQSACNRYIIPMPNRSDVNYYYTYDFDNEEGDRYILRTEGFYAVRNLIKKEQKERRERVSFWFSIIMGLIGGTIALVSVLKK